MDILKGILFFYKDFFFNFEICMDGLLLFLKLFNIKCRFLKFFFNFLSKC